MLTAKDIMTPNPVTVTPDTEILQAAEILLDRHFNGLPVVDAQGELKGILCRSDLVEQQKKVRIPSLFTVLDGFLPLSSMPSLEREVQKIAAATVAQAMTPDPITVFPDTPLDEIATIMAERNVHTLPVVENQRVIGVIGKEDILKTLLPKRSVGA